MQTTSHTGSVPLAERRTFPTYGKAALAMVALLLVWAVYTLGNQFLYTMDVFRKRDWENPQWTVTHTEIEFQEFLKQTAWAQLDRDSDLGSLRLAFDVFYSRVDTLRTGDVVEPLRTVPGFAAELEEITRFVNSAVAIIDLPDPELRAALPDLAAQAETLSAYLRRLQVISLENWATETVERREASVRVLTHLSIALAASFVLLLALVIVLWRLYRENLLRQQAIIEAHARTTAAEATLRKNEARLRESQKIAKLGSWEVNDDGKLYWSNETFRIFEFDREEFDGTVASFYARCHPEDIPRIKQVARKAWDTASEYEVTHRIEVPSGQIKTVVERAQPDVDASGKTVRLVGTVQDITERAIAEEQLRQSQKMEVVGQLTGGVAHDFNNLLAVILGNLELIKETNDPAQHAVFIQAAIAASERGAELTKNMLSFARKSSLDPSVTDLNKIVHETKLWSSRVLPETIDVEVSLLAGLWQVEVDRTLAQNALLNLLLNARDAMPDGGKLTIETSNLRIDQDYIDRYNEEVAPGRYVMLAVSDTGTGISEQQLARIFEPFYTTKPTGSGSGLGLSMVEGFMKQSGGTVRIYSEVGIGTTFKLYFKAFSGAEETPDETVIGETGPTRFKAQVLVAEDEPAVLEVLTAQLTRAGFSVTPATSGDDALRIWEAQSAFDLLVTDIVMPGTLQGTQLAKELRARRPDLPVIFLSGYANEAMVHGNGLRPDDIRLMKPVRGAELIAAVEKALERAGTGIRK